MAAPEVLRADICVVGAGAAGLWAAARAARGGRNVLLLEKTPRTGTKVLASGGTRCNLTTTLDAPAAGELFGHAGARFLNTALRALTPADVREHFARLGVETVEEPLEKVFPKSGSAREVRDALERDAREAGVEILCNAGVEHVRPIAESDRRERGAHGWRVETSDARVVECARLVLCPGGKSYAKTGTTGDGYRWLADLDLPVVEPVPALAPLSTPALWVRELAGVSVQDVETRMTDDRGRVLGRRRRPILFTHLGVSGPAAMDLSEHFARAEAEAQREGRPVPLHHLLVDLLPDVSRVALRDRLIAAASEPKTPTLSRVLPAEIPRRLVEACAHQAGLGKVDPRVNGLTRESRHELVEALKGFDVPIDGTLGFDKAEVTAGGLALTHVDPGTMRVRGYENLWACGEILDLAGPIGGLNFLSAFATAELAARDASRA